MVDRDGAVLEYVQPLMKLLFKPLHQAMWEQPSWTEEEVHTYG